MVIWDDLKDGKGVIGGDFGSFFLEMKVDKFICRD